MEFTDAPLEPFGETFLDMSIPTQLTLKTALVFRMVKELQKHACLPWTGAHHAELAFEEAITNAMIHGNRMDPARKVRVKLFADEARWGAVIEDEGEGFKPENIPDPNDAENLLRESGRGIMLIEAYVDELKYTQKGNRLLMARHRQSEPDAQEAAGALAPESPAAEAQGPVSRGQEEGFDFVQVASDRVDEASVPAIREAAMAIVQAGKPLLLDLGQVTYISSIGLSTLVAVYKAARAKNALLILASVQPAVMGIFRTAHLLTLFDGLHASIAADRAAGVKELKRRQ